MASGSTGRNVTDFVNEHQPDFRSKIQALVFAVHLHFVKEGCRLRALKEDDEEKNLAAAPGRWNRNEELFCFVYRKDNTKFILKCLPMDDLIMVNVMKEGVQENIISIELRIDDYVKRECNLEGTAENIYTNLNQLETVMKEQILSPVGVIPASSANSNSTQQQRVIIVPDPNQVRDPLRIGQPMRPRPNPFGGDFGGDMGGLFGPGSGGNMMGPGHGIFQPPGRMGMPNAGGMGMGGGFRYDPPGFGVPNPDHMQRHQYPQQNRRGGNRPGRGGFGDGFM